MITQHFITRHNMLKLSFESALIIFSVLLALFLNEYRGQLKEERQKALAMEMVTNEIEANLQTLEQWLLYHEQVLKNLDSELAEDNVNPKFVNQQGRFRKDLMPKGIIQSLINDASWQTLKSSAIATTIDFNTMLELSNLYKLQAKGVEQTINNILTIIASREALETDQQRVTLMLLRNAFQELTGQEIYLIRKYQEVLAKI